jgi:hypothetical protein
MATYTLLPALVSRIRTLSGQMEALGGARKEDIDELLDAIGQLVAVSRSGVTLSPNVVGVIADAITTLADTLGVVPQSAQDLIQKLSGAQFHGFMSPQAATQYVGALLDLSQRIGELIPPPAQVEQILEQGPSLEGRVTPEAARQLARAFEAWKSAAGGTVTGVPEYIQKLEGQLGEALRNNPSLLTAAAYTSSVLPALATLGVPTVNVPENIFPFLQQVVQGGTVRGQEVAANVLRALFELFGGAPLDFGVGITI